MSVSSRIISKSDGHKLIAELLDLNLASTNIINNAFFIYKQINDEPDHEIIDNMLRLCSSSNHPDKALIIWSDIQSLSFQQHNIPNIISLNMFTLDCCLKSNKIAPSECTEILRFLASKTKQLNVTMHTNTIHKLIEKCNKNGELLQFIHSLIDNEYFVGNTDIIKAALINAYSQCNENDIDNIQSIMDLFNSINNNGQNEVDIVTIGGMMKILVNNSYYKEALNIYDNIKDDTLNNEITHSLAIKACKGMKYYDRGRDIIQKNESSYSSDPCLLKTVMIDFYGHCGDIKNALFIYNNIDGIYKKTTTNVNAMMAAFIENNEYENALRIYDEFSLIPNDITAILAIKACKNTNNMEKGIDIHQEIMDDIGDNIELMNVLIDFYGYFGDISAAKECFDQIPDKLKNAESINLINTYTEYGKLVDYVEGNDEDINSIYIWENNIIDENIKYNMHNEINIIYHKK